MRSIGAVTTAVLFCGLLAFIFGPSEAGEAPPRAGGEGGDPDVVQWRFRCDLDDGRRLISDGSLLLESRYVPKAPVPENSVPAAGAQRLLQSETDREFGLDDLKQKAGGGHYAGPGGVQLNRKYVELLRGSLLKGALRFRAKRVNDPVLILDGKKVVGVMMPIKS